MTRFPHRFAWLIDLPDGRCDQLAWSRFERKKHATGLLRCPAIGRVYRPGVHCTVCTEVPGRQYELHAVGIDHQAGKTDLALYRAATAWRQVDGTNQRSYPSSFIISSAINSMTPLSPRAPLLRSLYSMSFLRIREGTSPPVTDGHGQYRSYPRDFCVARRLFCLS